MMPRRTVTSRICPEPDGPSRWIDRTRDGVILILALLVGSSLGATEARAAQYAAMKEVPVKGGELRLVKPVVASTPDETGAARTETLIAFPLKHTAVSVRVAGTMAHVTVEQTFENPFKQAIEAVYLFPLGHEAAVSGYEIVIGERVVRGEIKTREAARKVYEQARSAGHTAGLLQQEKANVFSQHLANLAPGERIKVRLRYVELLQQRDQVYELVYPMVVGPRYLPASGGGRNPVGSHLSTDGAPTGATSIPYVGPGVAGMPTFDLKVHVDTGGPICSFTSPSHALAVKAVDATTAEARLAATDRIPNKDFILRLAPRAPTTRVGLLAHRDDREGYLVLTVHPKDAYRTGDVTPREVVLLVDVSGSMDGPPLQHAKAVARAIVSHLGPQDSVNVISFASGVRRLGARALPASESGKASARAFIDALQAGGGTELERAVVQTLARDPGADRIRMVYVLTDGFVGNDDVILATARKELGHNRIFPVGVGSAPNRYLLHRLADVGRGFPTYIGPRESPEGAVATLVKRTTQPYLTDVTVDWGGLKVEGVTPARVPDVYAGLPLVLAARYQRPGKGTVTVRARTAGQKVELSLSVTLPERQAEPAVAHLWARRTIEELMALDYRDIHQKTRAEVTRLGLQFGLVTEFTSYVAVDRTRVVAPGGATRTVVQPVEAPEGVNLAMAVGTSAGPQGGGSSAGYSSGGGSSGGSYRGSSGGRWGGADLPDLPPWLPVVLLFGLPAAVALIRRRGGRA